MGLVHNKEDCENMKRQQELCNSPIKYWSLTRNRACGQVADTCVSNCERLFKDYENEGQEIRNQCTVGCGEAVKECTQGKGFRFPEQLRDYCKELYGVEL